MLTWARLLLVAAVAGHWGLQQFGDRLADFWVGAGIHGVATLSYIYLCSRAVLGTWRPTFWEAFALVLGLRLLVMPLSPALSDDVFRYMHEGHMVLERHNPYLTAPVDVAENLRLASYDRINHAYVPAAYPPLVQLCLALGYVIHPSALGMKVVFGAFDVMAFVLLWMWLPKISVPARQAVIYGLCPLVVLEFAGEGHSDSLAIVMTLLALWAVTGQRRILSGGFLALATVSKIMPVVLLPFVARRARVVWLAFGVVITAFYLPLFVDAALRERSILDVFEGTRMYGDVWRHNDSMFHVIYEVSNWCMQQLNAWWGTELHVSYFPHRVAKVPIVLLGLAILGFAWVQRWPLHTVATLFFVYFIAFTPTMHPWYLALLMPFLCIYPSMWMLAFTGTVYLAHSVPGRETIGVGLKIVEYLPFYLGLVFLARSPSQPGVSASIS